MKKIFITTLLLGIMTVPSISRAQAPIERDLILQLISLLQQQVQLLMDQLTELKEDQKEAKSIVEDIKKDTEKIKESQQKDGNNDQDEEGNEEERKRKIVLSTCDRNRCEYIKRQTTNPLEARAGEEALIIVEVLEENDENRDELVRCAPFEIYFNGVKYKPNSQLCTNTTEEHSKLIWYKDIPYTPSNIGVHEIKVISGDTTKIIDLFAS